MPGYEPRTYRQRLHADDLVGLRVVVEETDLHIQARPGGPGGVGQDLSLWQREWGRVAREAATDARRAIQTEIILRPEFRTSLVPLAGGEATAGLTGAMYRAARRAGVGPMAAVAGAVAESVGRALFALCAEVIVENGGDIFLSSQAPRTVAVLAGRSPLSGKIGVALPGGSCLGVCTSSATVGPSFSAGLADAALIIARDAALADAMASALGNRVRSAGDIEPAVTWAREQEDVLQALVVLSSDLGVAGEFEIVRL